MNVSTAAPTQKHVGVRYSLLYAKSSLIVLHRPRRQCPGSTLKSMAMVFFVTNRGQPRAPPPYPLSNKKKIQKNAGASKSKRLAIYSTVLCDTVLYCTVFIAIIFIYCPHRNTVSFTIICIPTGTSVWMRWHQL